MSHALSFSINGTCFEDYGFTTYRSPLVSAHDKGILLLILVHSLSAVIPFSSSNSGHALAPPVQSRRNTAAACNSVVVEEFSGVYTTHVFKGSASGIVPSCCEPVSVPAVGLGPIAFRDGSEITVSGVYGLQCGFFRVQFVRDCVQLPLGSRPDYHELLMDSFAHSC